MFSTPPHRKRHHSGSTLSELQSKYRRLISTGVSVATGVPEPIVSGVARILFPEQQTRMVKQDTIGQRSSSGYVHRSNHGKGSSAKRISPLCTFEYIVPDHSDQTNGGKQTALLLGNDAPNTLGISYSLGLFGPSDILQMAKQTFSVINDPTGATTSSTTKGQKVLVTKGMAEYYITNNSTVEAVLKLYELKVRRDVTTVNNLSYQDPITAWRKGATQSYVYGNLVEGSQDPTTYLDSQPFDSRVFCEAYKVCKVTKINMSPGAVHTHRVIQYHDKWIDISRFYDIDAAGALTSDMRYIGNLSTLTMAVFHGLPETITATGIPTTGGVKISVVTKTKYKYYIGATIAPIHFAYSDLATTAIGGLEAVAEATDTVVVDSQA